MVKCDTGSLSLCLRPWIWISSTAGLPACSSSHIISSCLVELSTIAWGFRLCLVEPLHTNNSIDKISVHQAGYRIYLEQGQQQTKRPHFPAFRVSKGWKRNQNAGRSASRVRADPIADFCSGHANCEEFVYHCQLLFVVLREIIDIDNNMMPM
ncbi:hypothetical protein GGS21DRAFT_329680 [Xylaria nigripes]|nr:hypothetical protein GGS21DRAFT_329680 [Xylaria nigripes]